MSIAWKNVFGPCFKMLAAILVSDLFYLMACDHYLLVSCSTCTDCYLLSLFQLHYLVVPVSVSDKPHTLRMLSKDIFLDASLTLKRSGVTNTFKNLPAANAVSWIVEINCVREVDRKTALCMCILFIYSVPLIGPMMLLGLSSPLSSGYIHCAISTLWEGFDQWSSLSYYWYEGRECCWFKKDKRLYLFALDI